MSPDNIRDQLLELKLTQKLYIVFFLAAINSQYKYDFLQVFVALTQFLPI